MRTTSITYVLAIANFNCARVDSNHPTRALNRGTKMTTVRSARKSSATYIFDFIDFLVRKEDSHFEGKALIMRFLSREEKVRTRTCTRTDTWSNPRGLELP